jgi:predicted histidine transporter YuiF (NhaC family)
MALFKSRSFWLAVVAVVQTVVLYYFQVPQAIWLSINALIGVVIAALTVDDAAKAIVAELKVRNEILKLQSK